MKTRLLLQQIQKLTDQSAVCWKHKFRMILSSEMQQLSVLEVEIEKCTECRRAVDKSLDGCESGKLTFRCCRIEEYN